MNDRKGADEMSDESLRAEQAKELKNKWLIRYYNTQFEDRRLFSVVLRFDGSQ